MSKSLTLSEAIAVSTERFEEAQIETAALDARVLVLAACGIDRQDLIANPDLVLAEEQIEQISKYCVRRVAREPIAHILGQKEFWSMTFKVTPETLVPRPDSETVVQHALSLIDDRDAPVRVLDLGTGSGCLLIALLSELPKASGLGVDISPAAIEVATTNSETHDLQLRCQFLCGEWTKGLEGPFDIIISNPPYIPVGKKASLARDIAEFEPALALFGGRDGLDPLRTFIGDVKRLLTQEGFYVMEYGQGQSEAVADILREAGLDIIQFERDLAGIERSIAAKVTKM